MKLQNRTVDHCIATGCHLPSHQLPGRYRKHDWYSRSWVMVLYWARGGTKQ